MPDANRPVIREGFVGKRSASNLLAVFLCLGFALAFAPDVGRAGFDPIKISVNTTSDLVALDGLCSLREAIITANGGNVANCGTGSGQGDSIGFSLSCASPPCVINLGTALPTITKPMSINGGTNRVKLHGPGSGNGLTISTNRGPVSISRLVIENFAVGISSSASDVTLTGSVIGPNADLGVQLFGGTSQIGGVSAVTTGGGCTGGCNVIAGNGDVGVFVTGHSVGANGSIQGNLIGTTADGTGANGNLSAGVSAEGTWMIGGTNAGEGNVISGNIGRGVDVGFCSCTIQGNRIGTNAAGTQAVPNSGAGIYVENPNAATVIGGTTPGSGNIISGNTGNGVDIRASGASLAKMIYRNRIGTTVTGGALGNGGAGIYFQDVDGGLIGAANDTSAANTIAFNGGAGVQLDNFESGSSGNQIRGNSIHSNEGEAILGGAEAPTVTGVGPVTGTACANCTVDIYSDSEGEGRVFHGSTTANAAGNWTFAGSVSGPNITAASTDVSGTTSMLSAPIRPTADGRIRKGTGSFSGNDLYNGNGANQTKTGAKPIGETIKFGISVQNDGNAGDRIRVASTGAATSTFTIKYFQGTTNITSAVVAGTYLTPSLVPGGTLLITVKVKVLSTATAGSSVTRLVTLTSVSNSTRSDVVKFTGTRK